MRIKEMRNRAGLSQIVLAEILGISQQAVGQWEAGITNPRAELIPQLAKALNCSIQDLFASPDTQDEAECVNGN